MNIKVGNIDNSYFNCIGTITLELSLALIKKLMINGVYFEFNSYSNTILVNLGDNELKDYLDSI